MEKAELIDITKEVINLFAEHNLNFADSFDVFNAIQYSILMMSLREGDVNLKQVKSILNENYKHIIEIIEKSSKEVKNEK